MRLLVKSVWGGGVFGVLSLWVIGCDRPSGLSGVGLGDVVGWAVWLTTFVGFPLTFFTFADHGEVLCGMLVACQVVAGRRYLAG
jgi:hypothetical protein